MFALTDALATLSVWSLCLDGAPGTCSRLSVFAPNVATMGALDNSASLARVVDGNWC